MIMYCQYCKTGYQGGCLSGIDICPGMDCGQGLYEIDELMLPILQQAHYYGIATSSCCSGHLYESTFSPYIAFECSIGDHTPTLNDLVIASSPWRFRDDGTILRFGFGLHVDIVKYTCSMSERLGLQKDFFETLSGVVLDGIVNHRRQ